MPAPSTQSATSIATAPLPAIALASNANQAKFIFEQPHCSLDATPVHSPISNALIEASRLGFLGTPLHFLTSKPEARRRRAGLLMHSCRSKAPFETCFHFSRNLAICSPEATFVQMGQTLSLFQLACFGMALCGIFAIDPRHVDTTRTNQDASSYLSGLPERRQLTTVEALQSYITRNPQLYGSRKARRALKLMADRSRSPMESITMLMLCSPIAQGGYALPKPLLNHAVELSSWLHDTAQSGSAIRKGKTPYAECDFAFFHHGKMLAVDYHGEWAHGGERSIHHDSLKTNAFLQMGLPYLTVTKQQVLTLALLDKLVAQIQAALGIKARIGVADYPKRKRLLHNQLAELARQHGLGMLNPPQR